MPYIPYIWHDGSGGGTPITAYRLNQLEEAVSDAVETAESVPPQLEEFATWDAVLPQGGASGQVLTKTSPASWDVEWRTPEVVEPGALPEIPPPVYPIAVLRNTSQQSLPWGDWATINLQSEAIDTHNGHSTSTDISRYTIPTGWGGYWELNANLSLGTSSGNEAIGRRGARFLVNGDASVTRQETMVDTSERTTNPTAHAIVLLNPGDYVQVQAYHDNDNYNTSTWVTPSLASTMTVKWLRRA